MSFWKALFGGAEKNPEEEKQEDVTRKFDLYKYDGIKALRMNQAEYAVKCFTEALKLKTDIETLDYLSQAFVRMGHFAEALSTLDIVRKIAPKAMIVYDRMGHIAYMMEDYERLDEIARQAQEQDPQHAHAYYMAAQAAVGSNNPVGAIAQLTQSLAVDDAQEEARLLRAQTLMAMGDFEAAQRDTDMLNDQFGADEEVMLLSARLAARQGKADEAKALYGRLIEENPFQADAFRERGKLLFDEGDKEGAEADMRKYLELRPEELNGVNGEYKAEGVEEMMKRAYSAINPFGL